MQIQGQVIGVTGRQVSTSRGMSTVYSIQFSDGNSYDTWKPEISTQASQLSNQQVVAEVSQNAKGYWQLDAIGPAGQPLVTGMAPGTSVPAGVPVQPQQQAPAPGIPISPPQQGGRGMDPEREKKIVKQSVLSTAYGFIGSLFAGAGPESLEEAVEKANELAATLYRSVMPAVPTAAPSAPVAAPTTPQEVAAQVPGVQVGVEQPAPAEAATPQPGDIPW